MRILLVEDDEIIGKAICHSLAESCYEVAWLQDGDAVEATLMSEEFSVMILDIALPTGNGIDVLKHIRAKGMHIPVLLLSARGSVEEITQGLDAGADDYLSKPFSLSVLLARLRALHRRSGQPVAAPRTSLVSSREYAGMRLDPNSYSVYIDGERISISRREYSLLSKLLENIGEVVPREALSQCIYGPEMEVESNAVEVHVHNLRKKLRANIIKTIRGVGYIVDAPRTVKHQVSAEHYA